MKVSLNLQSFGTLGLNNHASNPVIKNNDETSAHAPFEVSSKFIKENFFAHNNIAFKGFACSTADFDLKKVSGIDCPCCGQTMLTTQEARNFAESVGDKTGEDLENALEGGRKYYKPQENKIVNILIDTSRKHPEMNLKQLTALCASRGYTKLQSEQMKAVNQIAKLASKLPFEEQADVFKKLDETCAYIKGPQGENGDKYFKRKAFVNNLKEISQKYPNSNQGIYNKMILTAEETPNSHNDVNAFFVKFSRPKDGKIKTSEDIAFRLVELSLSSAEHIKPQGGRKDDRNNKGADNTANYIAMCKDCNSTRSNSNYNDFLTEHPEMVENLQKYLDITSELIKNRKVPRYQKYNDYAKDVAKAFFEETNGQVRLKINGVEYQPKETDVLKEKTKPTEPQNFKN